MTEVVVGNVDADKVVEDSPDICVVLELGVVDPATVELGVAVAVVIVVCVLVTGCWVAEAVDRISESI